MASYFDPDLTGQNPTCLITNYVVRLYKENQEIVFPMPVYYDSIMIKHLSTDVQLIKDVDYIPKIIAETEIGEIKGAEATWDHILVTSITLPNTTVEVSNLQISFQQLFPDAVSYNYHRGVNIELTPSLIRGMMDKIYQLEEVVRTSYMGGGFTEESSEFRSVDIDVSGINPVNFIEGEIHQIDSSLNRTLISPVFGSFLDSELVVRSIVTGLVLEKGIDYTLISFNPQKTKVLQTSASVYDFIRITKQMTGGVSVSYRAFGGLPSLNDFKSMYNKVNSISDYLSNNKFLTDNTFTTNEHVIDIYQKIEELENNMRQLVVGSPTYGDITSGTSSTKKIRAINNDINWWSIATLYKVQGSEDLIQEGIFAFSIELMNSGIQLKGSVVVDLTKVDENERFSVVIENNNPGIDKYKLHFRVIYNKSVGFYSGAILQIGISLQDYLEDTIGIEDLSGKESCWKLIPTSTAVVNPENEAVLLPDGTSPWNPSSDASVQLIRTLLLKGGIEILNEETGITVGSNDAEIGELTMHVGLELMQEVSFIKVALETEVVLTEEEMTLIIPVMFKNNEKLTAESTIELADDLQYKLTIDILNEEAHMFFSRVDTSSTDVPTVLVKSVKLM